MPAVMNELAVRQHQADELPYNEILPKARYCASSLSGYHLGQQAAVGQDLKSSIFPYG